MRGCGILSMGLLGLVCCGTVGCAGGGSKESMRDAVIFHASFDVGVDADVAAGDGRVWTVSGRDEPRVGNERADVKVEAGAGRHGGALRFGKKEKAYLFYEAVENMGFAEKDWEGSFSVWLSLDPDEDLEAGYCDPFQVTDKSALDESMFIEFSKDHTPRRFRLAACPPAGEWNPDGGKWEEFALSDRPVIEVEEPPFGRGVWTHVVVTFERFNSGKADGVARLYMNGKLRGVIEGWEHNYRWDAAKARMKIGLSYIGLMDDLAVFDRALSGEEVGLLYGAKEGVKGLR